MYVYFFLSLIEDKQDTKFLFFTAYYPDLYLNWFLETITCPSGQFETSFVSDYLSQEM